MTKPKHKIKREKLKESLENALVAKGLDKAFYADRLEQYMEFYDAKNHANAMIRQLIAGNNGGDSKLINLLAEARRLEDQTIKILTFLGLKPPGELPASGDDDL